MAHKRHYVLHINGQDFDVYGGALPLGQHVVSITLRRTKRATKHVGPNYDGSYNSIQAAILYAQVHQNCLGGVWRHLYDRRGQWVLGTDMRTYGNAWDVRVRELTDKYGWPIERLIPNHPGVWSYRLVLPRPRLIKINGTKVLHD
jgi:hypothetical protein